MTFSQALTVMEYLIANGSERALDDILDHSSRISVQSSSFFPLKSHRNFIFNLELLTLKYFLYLLCGV
jgi:ENTH domain